MGPWQLPCALALFLGFQSPVSSGLVWREAEPGACVLLRSRLNTLLARLGVLAGGHVVGGSYCPVSMFLYLLLPGQVPCGSRGLPCDLDGLCLSPQSPKGFLESYEELLNYALRPETWATTRLELEGRGVSVQPRVRHLSWALCTQPSGGEVGQAYWDPFQLGEGAGRIPSLPSSCQGPGWWQG